MRLATLLTALALTACGLPGTSDMPDPEDAQDVRKAAVALNPIAPGSTRKDTGNYGQGQPGSDRQLFIDWLRRYADRDSSRRQNIDYVREPVPASIADAIAEQRAYEDRIAARARESREKQQRERADEEARRAASEQERERNDAALEQESQERDQRYRAHMAVYAECVRLRELPTSPENSGNYPVKNCEQLRDEAIAGDAG